MTLPSGKILRSPMQISPLLIIRSSHRLFSEGRDVFPCDFRAKIDFFALNDCLCVIIMKNDGV